MTDTPPTVAQALARAAAWGLDRLDAQLLLGHVLGCSRAQLVSRDDAPLTAGQAETYADLCARRADDVPAAYLLGAQGFHGLDLQVGPGVLVPRPDTEALVDWALDLLPDGQGAQVLDLGTGSGAIALAVARARPAATVCATDLSDAALAVARANGERLKLPVQWRQGAWWQAVDGALRFDLVLSNPPYIAAGDPHLPALRHEPLMALTPGGDGLGALRTIVAGAPGHLRDGAWLLLEHGWDQASDVAALLNQAGFKAIRSRHDLGGRLRCTGGRWPGKHHR